MLVVDADGGARYKKEFAESVHRVIAPSTSANSADHTDTVVYPLVQMGPMSVTVDEQVTGRLFRGAPPDATLYLASGYFNLTSDYRYSIVDKCTAAFKILTAAPEVVTVAAECNAALCSTHGVTLRLCCLP